MKQVIVLSPAVLSLAVLAACSSPEPGDSASPAPQAQQTAAATGTDAARTGPMVSSDQSDIKIERIAVLPKAPASAASQADCGAIAPKSAAAKAVEAAGWGVTGEARMGRYQAVSFAGAFEVGTSGSCSIAKGNVGLFEGGALVALAYVPASSAETIGGVLPFEGRGLRIWSGDYLPQPVADILPDDTADGVTVHPLASAEKLCGGKVAVPNVYGLPISKARRQLRAKGWKPVPVDPATTREDSREDALVARGITEVDSCSGTGFGFCAYGYTSPQASLSVVTVGDDEDPTVSGYSVECDG